jgi:uncharacterized phage protein (TIGR02220 family)
MELISFIRSLLKEGKIYYDVWQPILFSLEENKYAILNRRLDISKTTYHRIIKFGLDMFKEKVSNINIEHKRGKLFIVENQVVITKKVSKPKVVEKTKKVDADINMNEVYESIISYLNNKAETNYKSETNSYRTFINSRLKSGYKLEDFYAVIDNKSSEWMGTDFQKFLRPETLFGNKFDSYLNQIITKKTKQEIAYEQVSKATKLGWNN